jgi:hydrogenase/urease accessory protein HupE
MGVAHLRIAAASPVRRRTESALKRLLLAALLLLTASNAGAHEIGTTQVRFTVHRDDTWSASITTGPQALVNKLEVEARQPRSSDLDADALRAKLVQFDQALARHIDVRFDGAASPVSIAISTLELPPDITLPSFVVLLASGPVPPHAQTVTWRYGLAYATYSVVFAAGEDGNPLTLWIEGDDTSQPFPVSGDVRVPTRIEIIGQYLQLGFLHIVPEGLDHILFVLGIFLLTTKLRPILVQVTAFTIAHSVTLGLTMYGIVSLPSRIVEPLIALSVAYVAIENIATAKLTPWRPAVVFGFGLLHGMGFADALRELPLPRGELIPALVSFNVGIELAQLAVIAAAFFSVAYWCRDKPWYRARIVIPASALIAATGLFWTVQRIAGF